MYLAGTGIHGSGPDGKGDIVTYSTRNNLEDLNIE